MQQKDAKDNQIIMYFLCFLNITWAEKKNHTSSIERGRRAKLSKIGKRDFLCTNVTAESDGLGEEIPFNLRMLSILGLVQNCVLSRGRLMSVQGSRGKQGAIVPLKGSNFTQRDVTIPSQKLNWGALFIESPRCGSSEKKMNLFYFWMEQKALIRNALMTKSIFNCLLLQILSGIQHGEWPVLFWLPTSNNESWCFFAS